MIVFQSVDDVERHVGREIGTSDWLTVSQDMIDLFARATGDFQWIHVDTERAAREMPGGRTIAHGYLLLSLLPRLAADLFRLDHGGPALNYGSNKIRFTQPVPAGSRIRLTLSVKSVDRSRTGARITLGNNLNVEGNDRPALIAETMVFVQGPL